MNAVLNKFRVNHTEAYGPFYSYIVEQKLKPTDCSDLINGTVEDIEKLGIEIVEAPEIPVDLAIDEAAFDEMLETQARMNNPDARRRDIASLRSIYYLRNGEPSSYLEKSQAVYVSHNWSLQKVTHAFFKPYFSMKSPPNSVQLCFVETILASRLWTKLPTRISKKPRHQVLAYTIGNLVANADERDQIRRRIDQLVNSDDLSDDAAIRVRSSRYLDELITMRMGSSEQADDDKIDSVIFEVLEREREKTKLRDRKIAEYAHGEVRESVKRELEEKFSGRLSEKEMELAMAEATASENLKKREMELIAEKSREEMERQFSERFSGLAVLFSGILISTLIIVQAVGALGLDVGSGLSFITAIILAIAGVVGALKIQNSVLERISQKLAKLLMSLIK